MQGCGTGMWQTLGVWKRGLENFWTALDPPGGHGRETLQGRDTGLSPAPPWPAGSTPGTSSCPAAAPPPQPWGPRGTILFPVVLEEGYGWGGRGWDGCRAL